MKISKKKKNETFIQPRSRIKGVHQRISIKSKKKLPVNKINAIGKMFSVNASNAGNDEDT